MLLTSGHHPKGKALALDIYRFMNSKDVAGYLRETDYELNAMEAAYLVEICDNATLDEKVEAWRWIIETMPDCAMAHCHDIEKCDSVHAFLLDYIDLQWRMLGMFEQGKGSVYFLRKARYGKWPEWLAGKGDDLWVDDYPRPFSTLAKCIDFLKSERVDYDEFDRYVISKETVDAISEIDGFRQNEIVLDAAFRPMSVLVSCLDERDKDMSWHLRDSFLKIPVPFRYGDIVIDRTSLIPHPFVFDHLKFWNSTELASSGKQPLSPADAEKLDKRVARADEKGSWDVSHMAACGYELGEHYTGGPLSDPCDLCFDVFGACGNYLNLEWYTEPLEGNLRTLRITSEFMKGEIDVSCAINFARAVSLDHHATELKNAYDSEYYKIGHLYGGESE